MRDLLFASLAFVVIALPLKGLYVATGASMEEGFMMVFPNLVNQGKIPNVDFLHLYGPASLGSLGLWFRVFGDTLEAQRIFGFGQHMLILSAIFVIARVAGRAAAAGATIIAAMFVLTPIGLTALAWHGAVGLGLWGAVFASRFAIVGRRFDLAMSGVLMGLALSFRPDVLVPILLVLLLTMRASPTRPRSAVPPNQTQSRVQMVSGPQRWGIALGSGALGLLPMWIHLLRAGIGPSFEGMFLDPVFHLRPGRELPTPPSWSHVDGALQAVAESLPPWWGFPAMPAEKQLFFWFLGVIIVAITVLVVVIWARRGATERDRRQWTALLIATAFGVGIVPQALQRPDSTHLAWVAMVSWPLVVPIGTLLWRRQIGVAVAKRAEAMVSVPDDVSPDSVSPDAVSPDAVSPDAVSPDAVSPGNGSSGSGSPWVAWAAPICTLAMAALIFVVCPFYTYRTYVLHTRVAVGDLPVPFVIERGERHFWVGDPAVSVAMAEMIPVLDERSEPGDRLFVGPGDLSKTVYADTYVYWLFSELEPSTYYIEMDPGLANAEGSGMAEDVKSADFVVLTNTWSGWMEPNTSVDAGSQESNEMIADEFCLVESYQTNLILLFERCEGGGGLNPADVAGRAGGVGGGGLPSDAIETTG